MPDLHLCFVADHNFGPYLQFAVASILFSAAAEDRLHFHILSHGIAQTDQDRLRDLAARERPDAQVEFTEFSYADFAGLAVGNWTPAIFGRFLIPRLFPELDRMIYLDGDIIVASSLALLWNTALDGHALGAVENFTDKRIKDHAAAIGMSAERYFNSGVLLLDCEKWRAEEICRALLDLGQNKSFSWPDQDLLNLYFEGRVKYLDPAWNVQTWQVRSAGSKIIHYCTAKPWSRLFTRGAIHFWRVALRLPGSGDLLPAVAMQARKATWLAIRLQIGLRSVLSALGLNREHHRGKIATYRQMEKLLPDLRAYFQGE